jgi:hypothetical protein
MAASGRAPYSAVGQNRSPDLYNDVPEPNLGPDEKVACFPACSLNPRAEFPTAEAADAYEKSYEIVGTLILLGEGALNAGRALFGLGKGAARAAPKLFSTAETQGLKNLFGTGQKGAEEALKRVSQGARDLPAGVTRETLGRYKQQIIDKGLQDIPVQSKRLRIIEELLK